MTLLAKLVFINLLIHGLGQDFKMTILHTNDVHSRFEETDEHGRSPCNSSKCYGGVARRLTAINKIRRTHRNVLLMDAGDQFQGTIWFNYYKGNATKYFLKRLGYDVIALGHHEFDGGIKGLTSYLRDLQIPVVCSNMDSSSVPDLKNLFTASNVFNVGGRQVGVIGYITELTPLLVKPDGIRGLRFRSIVESMQNEVDRLKARGVNIIIGLGHAGLDVDLKIAAEVKDLDLIVGGQDNTFLYNGKPPAQELPRGPYPVTKARAGGTTATMARTQHQGEFVPIIQAYKNGKYLGYLNLTFDNDGKLLSWAGNPILLDSTVDQDQAIKNDLTNTWKPPLQTYKSTQVGNSLVYMEGENGYCRLQECNMGNMVTDAMIDYYIQKLPPTKGWVNASVALWNSGGFVNSIQKGSTTRGDIMEAFPYGNTVELIQIKGLTLLNILEHSVSKYNMDEPSGRFLQYSGLKVEYDLTAPLKMRVKSILVLCASCDVPEYEMLTLDRTYSVLTNLFLIQGGDGYDMLQNNIIGRVSFGDLLTDVVGEYMQKFSPLKNGVEGRIKLMDDTPNMVTPTVSSAEIRGCTSSSTKIAICPLLRFSVIVLLLLCLCQNR